MWWWISSLATTSTPTVGDSSTRASLFPSSQRPRSTFCWLPPLSWDTGWPGRCTARKGRRSRPRRACGPPCGRRIPPGSPWKGSRGSRSTRCSGPGRCPPARRSSGTKPMPRPTTDCGDRVETGTPFRLTVPADLASPTRARTSCCGRTRRCPSGRPPPLRVHRSRHRRNGAATEPVDFQDYPAGVLRENSRFSTSCPTMCRLICAVVTLAAGASNTFLPSRRIVTWSLISSTSSR